MGVSHQLSVDLVAITVGEGGSRWGFDMFSLRQVLVSCQLLDMKTVPGLEPCLPELTGASNSAD